jgi:nucleoside-diphosphate-sugar epimerase
MVDNGRVIVTGGAGFLGSHMCRALLKRGHEVLAVDNLCTGTRDNIADLLDQPRFSLIEQDVSDPFTIEDIGRVVALVHLACPASPKMYTRMPVETLRVGSVGTLHMLELARRCGARALIASSSEVYGDPLVHPQSEDYCGNVDPIGPHCAYNEAKRFAEAAAATYHREKDLNVGIVRPFNIYGPNMWPNDGRVVASFCAAALRGETLSLHNGGTQTRSFLYIDDAVDGVLRMLSSDTFGPINLGSDEEITIRELAELVVRLAGSGDLNVAPGRDQDVNIRRADTTRARAVLGWEASTPLRQGLGATLTWMRRHINTTVGSR